MNAGEIIGIVVSVVSCVVACAAFRRNRKMDDADEGKESGAVLTELGYIKSGIDDIKRRQERFEEQHLEVVSRLVAVEESAKQAHKRIDRLERSE